MWNSEDFSGYKNKKFYPTGGLQSYININEEHWNLDGSVFCSMADTKVEFFEDGEVKSFILGEDINLDYRGQNFLLKKGQAIQFYKNGKICSAYVTRVFRIFCYFFSLNLFQGKSHRALFSKMGETSS